LPPDNEPSILPLDDRAIFRSFIPYLPRPRMHFW